MKYNIYKLLDPDTLELMYIGKTTNSLQQRLVGHLNDAHMRPRVFDSKQEWIKKLILDYKLPRIESLEITDNPLREEYWIKKLKPFYNLMFAENIEYSKYMQKIKAIPVYQYSLDGIFIKKWTSITEAARELKLIHSNIYDVCRGRRKSCGGFTWTRDETLVIKISPKKVFKKEIHMYSLEGKYLSSYDSARELPGFAYKVISKCCTGKSKTYKGFRFSFDKVDNLGVLIKKK
jgi:hypothetical protein